MGIRDRPYDTYIPYDVYIAPGLVGMVLLFNGMQSSLAMVYDREMGVMRLLLTAPLPRWYLLLCKLLAGTLLSVLPAYVFLAVAALFDVGGPGSGWLAALAGPTGAAAHMGTTIPPIKGASAFECVSFSYPGRPPALQQVDLQIGAGEIVSLRRGSCTLHGSGTVGLGGTPTDPGSACVSFGRWRTKWTSSHVPTSSGGVPLPHAGMPVRRIPFLMMEKSSPSVRSWVSPERMSGARG